MCFFFFVFWGSLHSGRSKVTRVTVGRAVHQCFRVCKDNLATLKVALKNIIIYRSIYESGFLFSYCFHILIIYLFIDLIIFRRQHIITIYFDACMNSSNFFWSHDDKTHDIERRWPIHANKQKCKKNRITTIFYHHCFSIMVIRISRYFYRQFLLKKSWSFIPYSSK